MEIIKETNYQKEMDSRVMPFLNQYRFRGYFNPDDRETAADHPKEQRRTIYYERYLQKPAKGVILMVHGFSETAEKYVEMIYYFLQAGYQVYIPDMRGHGRSARESSDRSLVYIDRYERYVADLEYLTENIIKKENPELPVYLYAHSMGGGICAALLVKNPDIYPKAVLSSPMMRILTGKIPFFMAHMIAALQVRLGNGKKYAAGQHEFRADESYKKSAASSRERYEYYYRKKLKEPLFQTCGASYSWLRESARVSGYILKKENCRKIHADILLLQAQQDDYVDRKSQDLFAERTEGARIVRMSGTKHEIYMSHDAEMKVYLEQILAFLQ